MSEDVKKYSEMERFEIINISNGEKYNFLGNNDVIIDEEGNFKLLILASVKNKFSFLGKSEFFEVPWEYVKKIGTRTIIIDIEESTLKNSRI
ncbi:photosystem reaction center subunit H [Clostridium tetani]|uniref:Photosystem reaction center subunit H n=1 Tax=Clostridium tetani TaxID=1513 RepID=A0A4Q0VA86_CLOTA|nr:YlmC/YmxH family sporulation protein [Clostridium tetani]CDI49381.1 Sporulation protein YlmC/YmxH [Clostridium tetani 12124569]AVP53742.1 YlmC/YmxH family sporulation protein [Clostridium tetani]KGI38247.1 photosystem reaction center subunit H [Clostridium tetani]KGI40123.1 photosystem reaction center subunit H [Clostridium tetani ATCC 9441]KGI41802.1 photosystem reaction center subunit H [Clostridium tetani]